MEPSTNTKAAAKPKKEGAKKPKRKQLSGGAKLKAAGKRCVLLGLNPEVYEQIAKAAAKEMRKVTQFITFHSLRAAQSLAP